MIYTKEELQAIGEWAVANQLVIVADDIYGHFIYGDAEFTPIATISDAIRAQTIIINGVSKTYSMTGWRIGFAIGDQKIIRAMTDLASQASSNPTAVSQYAAIEALSGSQESVEVMRQAFEERMEKTYQWLSEVPGITVRKPQGAFYLFPNVRETMTICGYEDVNDFVEALLVEANVAVVTGKGFGAPDNIRLSYAADLATLEEAVKRIKHFVEKKQQK
jgi:aspartate/methionine/tyrosine aminotransferase